MRSCGASMMRERAGATRAGARLSQVFPGIMVKCAIVRFLRL